MNIPKHVTRGCLARGRDFESRARAVLESYGYVTSDSTDIEDIYHHVDFWAVGSDGCTYGFDAKSMKRLSRSGDTQDEWTFVEWRNVVGRPGWLLEGSDMIAFERARALQIVRRSDLLEFCRRRVNRSLWVDRSSDAKYCMYTRPGRKDAISLFRFDDLDIPTKTLEIP